MESFKKHESEKQKVREIKQDSKQRAIENNKHISAVFDLQQVIHLPISKESALFYKQRLSFYNFTIYDLASKDCYCYTWDETQSKRGASEIASCIYRFLQVCENKGAETVDLFSDGCFGQNKNSVLPAMYMYFLKSSKNIKSVHHYFFETCHGQSEGDSAHSTINRAIKVAGDLFLPSQIIPIIKLARRKHPYIVVEMNFYDFLDFKKLSQDLRILTIRSQADDSLGKVVINWTKIFVTMVNKSDLSQISFKNSHFDTSFRTIRLPRNVNLSKLHVTRLNRGLQKIPKKNINLYYLYVKAKILSYVDLNTRSFFKNVPH